MNLAVNAQQSMLNAPPSPASAHAPLRGSVVASYRTYKGKRLGPYFFRKWNERGKVHKQYIRPEDLERVKSECQSHREERLRKRAGARAVNRYLDNWMFMGKQIFKWEKGKDSTPEQYAYLDRLNKEGMYITGRPLYRRRRVFGDPSASKLFLDCLIRTKDLALTRFMVAFKIHPDDVDVDLSPTNDPDKDKSRFSAISNYMFDRAMLAPSP